MMADIELETGLSEELRELKCDAVLCPPPGKAGHPVLDLKKGG